jgi:hypothetical protein
VSATRVIPRRESGFIPEPSGRSLVQRPCSWLVAHYTGGSGPTPGDGQSDAAHMATLYRAGVNMGKPYEYNYVLTYPNGWCWEWAGGYQSAHCLNANAWSIGVQFNLGVGQPPGQMVDTWRWLRAYLVATGQLTADHQVCGHYRLRSTACPGPSLAEPAGARWSSPTGEGSLGNLLPSLLVPWDTPPPPPPTTTKAGMLLADD